MLPAGVKALDILKYQGLTITIVSCVKVRYFEKCRARGMFGEHAYEEEENSETLASCLVSKRFFSSYLIAKA